jgi:hypothetical protein
MDIIQLSSFNGSTIYFMSCHGSFILFTEALCAGCLVLELMFQIYVICVPLPRGLSSSSKKYGMQIAWLLDYCYSSSGVLTPV